MEQSEQIIVAATRNEHKIREIGQITSQFGMKIISRDEAGIPPVEILEDGKTFEENSYKKAYEIMKLCGQITIADDSGIEADALGCAPGIYSARYAAMSDDLTEDMAPGEDSDDEANNQKLMRLLAPFPYEERTGRFVSVITMVFPDGDFITSRGTVEGHILLEERGSGGFGYDPTFVPEGYDKTFGELPAELKNRISHRANALNQLKQKLEERQKQEAGK